MPQYSMCDTTEVLSALETKLEWAPFFTKYTMQFYQLQL
jgi:hypothetical protein